MFIPLILGTFCGLRRGEITALRWKSVDLDNAQLAVIASTEQTDAGAIREKEAKSGRARTIALPSLAVEELRRWRLAQAEELLRLGVRADDGWHVVTQKRWVSPAAPELTHVVSAFSQGMGSDVAWSAAQPRQPHVGIVHPKIVQERLRHSSIAITVDIYSHAASAVDGVLRAAINKRANNAG